MELLPISDLKSLKPGIVINALEQIDYSLQNSGLPIDYPELYHQITPLFSHNHYKIKKYALIIAQKIIEMNEEEFPEILDTFPKILPGIISVNKEIVKISDQFIQLILHIYDVSQWWPIFQNSISSTHYLPFKMSLLNYSLPFSNELPIKPICKLLEDPAIQIQKLAMEILEKMDPERLKEAIVQAKVLGNIHTTNEQMEKISHHIQLPQNYKITLNPIGFLKPNHNKQSNFNEQENENIDNNEENNQVLNQEDMEKNDPLKSERPSSRPLKQTKRSFSIQSGDSISLNKVQLESPNQTIIKTNEENQNDLKMTNTQKKDNSNPNSNKPLMNNIIDQGKVNHIESTDNLSQKRNFPFQNRKKSKPNSEIVSHNSPETKKNEETIGHPPLMKKEPSISFKLKNLSELTLENKIKYLNLIDKSTEKGNFIYPADRILECVLTAVFPIHQRVSPILVKIISNLIVHNPEVALPFLYDILNFIISSQGIFIENDKTFKNLCDTLILEVNGNEIVTQCLNIVNSSKRPLHLEHFLISLFTRLSDLKLKKQQFFGVLDYLFHRSVINVQNKQKTKQTEEFQSISKESQKLKSFLAQSQPNLFKEWVFHQAFQDQPQLLQYLKNTNQNSPLVKQINKRVQSEDKKFIDHDPMKTALSEMKKGRDGDLQIILSCLNQIDYENIQISRFFQSLLHYLSILEDEFIEAQNDNLNRICTSIFFSPDLFMIFNNPEKVTPSIIRGFSCFIWHCSTDILKDSDRYYPQLYQIYKKSKGEQRKELCIIFLAIEKYTEKSILSIKGIHPKHYEIIKSTLLSFE